MMFKLCLALYCSHLSWTVCCTVKTSLITQECLSLFVVKTSGSQNEPVTIFWGWGYITLDQITLTFDFWT